MQDITPFNDSLDLSLKGSWICSQAQMQKLVIHRVLSFHIETVCLLVLRNPVTHINIDVDVEEMVQDKRGLATYGQIKDHVLETQRLKG